MDTIRLYGGVALGLTFYACMIVAVLLGSVFAVIAVGSVLGISPHPIDTDECRHLSVYEYVCHKR